MLWSLFPDGRRENRTCPSISKKARQCLYFIRSLKRFGMSTNTLKNFHRYSMESMIWYGGAATAQDRKKLQRVLNLVSSILDTSQDIFKEHCLRKAAFINKDLQHPFLTVTTR